jgi:hypothetical protein
VLGEHGVVAGVGDGAERHGVDRAAGDGQAEVQRDEVEHLARRRLVQREVAEDGGVVDPAREHAGRPCGVRGALRHLGDRCPARRR